MKRLLTIVALMTFGLPLYGQSQSAPPRSPALPDDESGQATTADIVPSLAGRWRSTPYGIPLSSELDVSVYGANAQSIRVADLTLNETGHGTVTVTRRVVDRRGQTVKGTRSIEEVTFDVGDMEHSPGGRPHYGTRIGKAERRYPETPGADRFPIEGVELELIPSDQGKTLDIRFDTADGNGSFSETMRRVAAQTRRNTAKS
jgi:hypothetical protein